MTQWQHILAIEAVSALLLLWGASSLALAASPNIAAPANLALTVREINKGDAAVLSIMVRLTDAERPLGDQTVDFFVSTDFFGKRLVNIGQAVTDSTGTATITYQPRWEGTNLVTVRFPGDVNYSPVETSRSIQVSGPLTTYVAEKVSLGPVGGWVLGAAGLLFGAVWALLVFIVIRLVKGISRFGPEKGKVTLPHESAFVPTRDSEEAMNLEKGVTYASTKIRGNRS